MRKYILLVALAVGMGLLLSQAPDASMAGKVHHHDPTPSPTPTQPPAADPVAAINAAHPGDTVVVGVGIFSGSVNIPNGVTVQGAGMMASWLKGRITYGSNCVVRDVRVGDAGYSVRNQANASTTLFERVKFRGGGGSGGDWYNLLLGDWARSCDHITFKDCEIECNLGTGNNARITENSAAGGAHVDSVTFDGCHFGVSNGVRSGCPRMDLEVVCIDLANGDTVYTHGWSNLVVRNCTFEPSDWYNLDLADHVITGTQDRAAGPALITGNTFLGGDTYTICTESPAGVVIEGNLFYRGGVNTVKFGCGDMSLVECATVIRNNTFDLDTSYGISLGNPAFYVKGGGNVITGNVIFAHAFSGTLFLLEQARNNTITGNTISTSTSRIFAGDYAGSGNVLSPNTVN